MKGRMNVLIKISISILLLSGIGIGYFVFYPKSKKIKNEDPQKIFKEFICDPIPEGVKKITYSGNVSFASTSVIICFEIDNIGVFNEILDLGNFKLRHNLFSKDYVYEKQYNGYQTVQLSLNQDNLTCQAYYGGG